MMQRIRRLLSLTTLLATCGVYASAVAAQEPLRFRDVGDELGLYPTVAGIAGHAAAWGDANGDGWADLYVGTFGGAPYGSKNNMLFFNRDGKRFEPAGQKPLQVMGRASGAVFADLDNDGDLDLYLSNHAIDGTRYKQPHFAAPNFLFENDGKGNFTDASERSNLNPALIAARSVSVLDYDGDALLDLLVGEDFFQGGQSRSRLYRNRGKLVFEDVTEMAGLPKEITGFGVAAGDVSGDGWPDVFLAGRRHGNRLFVNDGKGRFRELPKSHGDFTWDTYETPDDTTCGVAFGDVNVDGRLDIAVGSHFSRPWTLGGVGLRLYLNRGEEGGLPKFEDVSQSAGLAPLAMKSPHVEVQDFDNDGRPDLYTSIVRFAPDGTPHPVIFRNAGGAGLPKFAAHALTVNDFPTDEDRQMKSVLPFFDKMREEKKVIYMAPGPSCDYDRDGRVDLFLPNWWVDSRSLLLKNESDAGHWLQVQVSGAEGVNPMGIGAVVKAYLPGQLGQPKGLIAAQEIAVGYGYASGQEAVVHLGLGEHERCDLEIVLPHGKGRIEREGVEADQRVSLPNGS